MSFLTIEQKREIVRRHYEAAYKIKVRDNLTDTEISLYYDNIQKLRFSEERHKDDRPKLKLILNPDKFRIAYPEKTEE